MSDGDGRSGVRREAGRDYGSVALAAACVVAVVLATALVPAATAVGLGGSPAESLVPLPPGASGSGNGSGSGPGTGSGFGALNAGERTAVGGSLAQDDGNPFRSQDTEVHFRVRSEEASYWRTGAYDTYTGEGWSRSGPSDATAPVEGRQVRYRVDLAQSATSAPTVWRPTSVDEAGGLSLTDGGLARAEEPLSAGTTYVGVSRKPPRDPAVLRATGRDYPDDIERRYTELPPSTAVSLQPFTRNITAGADSPYETAVRVEEWLESTKNYSLNVSEPSSGNVAREFITQMDAGYCEYFATAMVTMLRSQEIPARYVVGYSTGQQVGANAFQVRAMNAHAWVEVYFADVGWVRFDPTPGAERLAQEQQAYEQSGASGTYAPQEEGSPGEAFSPNPDGDGTADTRPIDDRPSDGPGATPPPTPGRPGEEGTPSDSNQSSTSAYDVSLNRTAVPGSTVEVTVTAGAQPVVDALVEVNGRAVGRTDRDGTVLARVPYAENLTVTVVGGSTTGAETPTGGASSLSAAPQSVAPLDTAWLASQTRDNTTRSFDVATEARLSVSGDVRTGGTVLVTATVEGVPVRNATVRLDGERVGRTDDAGRARVALPTTPGNVTVSVARDPIAGNTTLALGALQVRTDPVWPLPVAGSAVEVTATLGDDSAAGVPVRVGGARVGETGVDGTVTARLPFESSVPVAVTASGQTARTTVSNPLANAVAAAGAALALVVAGGVAAVRGSLAPRALARRAVALLAGGARWAVRAFVGATALAAARLRRTVAHVRAALAGERSVSELVGALAAWVVGWRARLQAAVAGANQRGEPASTDEPAADDADAAHLTIREAWGRFLGYVSVRRPWTKTPGQVADHAVSADGLPADAVATLRDEFRAVEYGPRSADDSVPAVERAIERIERAVERGPDDRSDDASASGPENGSGPASKPAGGDD